MVECSCESPGLRLRWAPGPERGSSHSALPRGSFTLILAEALGPHSKRVESNEKTQTPLRSIVRGAEMAEQADAAANEAANEAAERETAAALAMLRRGAPDGMDRLIPLVYAELRRVAHRQLTVEPAGHTLSTTALVHEAYLRIADQTRAEWTNRAQFFGLAARAMRRVLVDYARRHQAARRGGSQQQPVAFEDVGASADALTVASRGDELLALDEALERLSALDARLG